MTSSEVVVRPSTVDDVETICALCAAGFAASSRGLLAESEIAARSAEYYNAARVRTEVEPSPPHWSGYLVAECGGRVVGAIGGSLADDVGHVLVLYLALDARGRGVGTALLDVLAEQQRAAGAIRQRASVTEGNEMGLPFYRARGFVEVDRKPLGPAPEPGRTARSLVMERGLGLTVR